MNDIQVVAQNALALLIIFLLFGLIYLKVRKQSLNESWDEIKNWIGGTTK